MAGERRRPAPGRRRRRSGIGTRLVALALLPTLLAVWFGVDAARGRLDEQREAETRRDRTEAILALTELRSQVLQGESLELYELTGSELGAEVPEADQPDVSARAAWTAASEAVEALRSVPVDRLARRPGVLQDLESQLELLRTTTPQEAVDAAARRGPGATASVISEVLAPAVGFAQYIDDVVTDVHRAAALGALPDTSVLPDLADAELLVFREGVAVLGEVLRGMLAGEPDRARVVDVLVLAGEAQGHADELAEDLPIEEARAVRAHLAGKVERNWRQLRSGLGAAADVVGTRTSPPIDFGSETLVEGAALMAERMTFYHDLRVRVGTEVLADSAAAADRAGRDLRVGAAVALLVLIGTAVAAAVVVVRLLRNLRLLREHAEQVAHGDGPAEPVALTGHDETAALGSALDEMTATLAARVAASEDFARSLVDATDEAILTIDDQGVIRSANHAASRLLGRPADELPGQHASELADRFPLLSDVPVGVTNADAVIAADEGEPRSVLVTTRRTGDEHSVVAVFARDISERKLLEDRLAHEATHDHLTGLANRSSLVAELERAAARSGRSGNGVGLLFIDLDRFKAVNDTLGHQAGDHVLRDVANRIRHATREADLVARNGGDEFVVLAEEAEDIATIVRLAERIQLALSDPFQVGEDTIPVSASIGVTFLQADEMRSLDQLRDADVAMYHAKSTGPGQIRVFDDDLRRWVEDRFDLERELRRAVGVGALDAHIQPIIDLRRGTVVGGELLCRWTTDDGREVPPHAFIEVAEDSTLVVEIGRWMLDRAGARLAEWEREGSDLTLSVNISGRHIDHPGVVEDVAEACARWEFDPSRLLIELTETALLRDLEEAAETLQQLREVGVRICVDDFGVGYASLRYLRELPVELVKIDRSIVAGFGRVDSDTVIITMLSRLADVLEIGIVAEGVETEEQREQLADLGCHFAQGFLFARPMPVPSFNTWLTRWRRQHTHPSAWVATSEPVWRS